MTESTENIEVEQAKDAFAEGQAAEKLRTQLTKSVAGFVSHGGDRDWANAQLVKLGAAPISGTSEYRMNIPITGAYGWRCKANSRAEALERFQQQVTRLTGAGKITADGSYDNVYELKFVGEPVFYSGPEDPDLSAADDLDLDGLKAGIREMFKQGIAGHGWNVGYATRAIASMGLDPLPSVSAKAVQVPVSGTATVSVMVFEGDDQADVQASAAAALARQGSVYLKPEEIGTVAVPVDADPMAEDVADGDEDFYEGRPY